MYSSDLDINILDEALLHPNLPLSIPLPNESVGQDFSVLSHFFKWFTLVDYDSIYRFNELAPEQRKYCPQFNRAFHAYMDHQLKHDDHKLDDLVEEHVQSELKLRILSPSKYPQRVAQVKQFIIDYYTEQNNTNLPQFGLRRFLQLAYITVISVVVKMFPQGVWVSRAEVDALHLQFLKDPMLIAFLPNHQLHVDYIILHLILIRIRMLTPTVIAGDNLNVAIFGSFLKQLGAIFIPRSFDGDYYSETNLGNAIEYLLLKNVHFEVFIEGTRSRDGKVLLPKYGVLKALTDIYTKQKKTSTDFDVWIQPVGITYERVYEADGYINEMIGHDKRPESFMNIVGKGYKHLFGTSRLAGSIIDENGYTDNRTALLNGKILVSFARGFPLSLLGTVDGHINVKQLGFSVLRESCWQRRIPEIAVVGLALHMYCECTDPVERVINAERLVPIMRTAASMLEHVLKTKSPSNVKMMQLILSRSDHALLELIQSQSINLLRHVAVNTSNHTMIVSNRIELVYYKNLTIHALLPYSMVCVLFQSCGCKHESTISEEYRIVANLLRNEFLLDYDDNPSHKISSVLQTLVDRGILRCSDARYTVANVKFVEQYASLVTPLLNTYSHVIAATLELGPRSCTTKEWLKTAAKIGRSNGGSAESTNKQYLLSGLYFLNYLGLVSIRKDTSKRISHVSIVNAPRLDALLERINRISLLNAADRAIIASIVDKNLGKSKL